EADELAIGEIGVTVHDGNGIDFEAGRHVARGHHAIERDPYRAEIGVLRSTSRAHGSQASTPSSDGVSIRGPMLKIPGVEHVAIAVDDIDAAFAKYREVFGLESAAREYVESQKT